MDTYIGTVMLWAPSFAPRGWAYCAGQLVAISQNTALFSLIGTTYGGNGTVTFGLPDLRSRVPVGGGMGDGPGLPVVQAGEMAGAPTVTLLTSNLPGHAHPGQGLEIVVETAPATDSVPTAGQMLAAGNTQQGPNTLTTRMYAAPGGAPVNLSPLSITGMTGIVGNGLPVSVTQPYLGISFIICMEGIFPPRP